MLITVLAHTDQGGQELGFRIFFGDEGTEVWCERNKRHPIKTLELTVGTSATTTALMGFFSRALKKTSNREHFRNRLGELIATFIEFLEDVKKQVNSS